MYALLYTNRKILFTESHSNRCISGKLRAHSTHQAVSHVLHTNSCAVFFISWLHTVFSLNCFKPDSQVSCDKTYASCRQSCCRINAKNETVSAYDVEIKVAFLICRACKS